MICVRTLHVVSIDTGRSDKMLDISDVEIVCVVFKDDTLIATEKEKICLFFFI